jgi:hypothetical protein
MRVFKFYRIGWNIPIVQNIDYLEIFNSIATLQWKCLSMQQEMNPHFGGFPLAYHSVQIME